MKKHITTALLYTLVTTVLLGVVYPMVVTGVAQAIFHDQANGQLILNPQGSITGSKLIGQPFTGAMYFHSRPSAAGTGYDAQSSGGSNLGPTSKALVDRVKQSVQSEHTDGPVPVDLVTASGSGLDPDITPAAALYQVARVASQRHIDPNALSQLVKQHITTRQFGILGEPRVNVLELNLALDAAHPIH